MCGGVPDSRCGDGCGFDGGGEISPSLPVLLLFYPFSATIFCLIGDYEWWVLMIE
ncbi:hypothetical protein A2U01_0116281, partial [Trifolium medium]|nr:hypothetical protein [Trifolium medium]